jgi:uncharacterized membrane protein YidH (DUF202 family)
VAYAEINRESVQETPQTDDSPVQARIRPRVIVLILLMQMILLWWTADSEIARSVYFVPYGLMIPTTLYLLLIRLLRRWLPFDRRELLLGYIVLTITLPIVGFGGLRFLITGMGYLPYFTKDHPSWARYLPFLSQLPILHDPQAIRKLYEGNGYVPWRAWIEPICFWSLYLMLLTGVWLGLAAVLHRIWIRQERLTFPIAVLPLELMEPQDKLFRSPLFWMGCAIPVVLESLLALHQWFPSIPSVQLGELDIKETIFSSPPWNAIPDFPISFYPLVIGLAYFVPSNVSFSCWFFSLLTRFSCVLGGMFGLQTGSFTSSNFPYMEDQAVGAWIAFALLILAGARFHWASLMQSVRREDQRAIQWWGVAAILCAILCAVMMMAVGVLPLVAIGVTILHIAYVLSGARVRAEVGGAWTFAPVYGTPYHTTTMVMGPAALSDHSLVAGAHFDLINVDIRAKTLPYMLEGLKIADATGIRWRTVLTWAALGTVSALAIGWWSTLSTYYHLGAATAKVNDYSTWKAGVRMNEMDTLANSHGARDWTRLSAIVLGAGFTFLLAWCRTRWVAFPFHPVGYVLCNTYTISYFFVPFFIAWLTKVLVQRWGGVRMYRKSLAFFIGLILGDMITQAIWALIGQAMNVPIYHFLD